MAKINPDHTLADMASPAHGRVASAVYQEQWQRVYEQAHLERQVAAMSRGAQEGGSAVEPKRLHVSLNGGDAEGSRGMPCADGIPAAPMEERIVIETKVAGLPPETVPVPAAASGKVSSRPHGGAMPSLLQQPAPAQTLMATTASRGLAHAIRGELPESSSVTVMATNDGVHIVIRDSKLTAAEVKHNIAKIRRLLQLRDQTLSAVTLNGNSIWIRPSTGDWDDLAADRHTEQGVDHLY